MKDIFVCGRLYDLYVAISYALANNEVIDLVLSKDIIKYPNIISSVKLCPFVDDVICIDDRGLHEKVFFPSVFGKFGIFVNLLFLRYRAKKNYEKYFFSNDSLESMVSYKRVNLFFVNTALKVYVYDLASKVRFFEEGLGIYSKKYSLVYRCVYFFLRLPDFYGRDQKVEEVLLTNPGEFKCPESKKNKWHLNDYEKNLSFDNKILIQNIFLGEMFFFDEFLSANKTLIVGQPLSEDGHMLEEEKNNLYQLIVEKMTGKNKIFFKPHPREVFDYRGFFPEDVVVISADIPIEVFNIIDGLSFEFGITFSSTALNNFSFVNNKIFLASIFSSSFQYSILEEVILNEL